MHSKHHITLAISNKMREENNIALIGHLNVHLYWYPRTMKTRQSKPIIPVSTFNILLVCPGTASWGISRDFEKRNRGNFSIRDITAHIKGHYLSKGPEESLWKGQGKNKRNGS